MFFVLEIFNALFRNFKKNLFCSQVNLLRLEAAKCGFLPTSRPARGRGGFRARGFRGMYTTRGAWRGARGT